jgi:hypothetical protein
MTQHVALSWGEHQVGQSCGLRHSSYDGSILHAYSHDNPIGVMYGRIGPVLLGLFVRYLMIRVEEARALQRFLELLNSWCLFAIQKNPKNCMLVMFTKYRRIAYTMIPLQRWVREIAKKTGQGNYGFQESIQNRRQDDFFMLNQQHCYLLL